MLAYRKMVEEIRAYLNSPDQSADEKVRGLAGRYAAVCQEVNDRLRQCQLFLEQGFRSQAIFFAEVEPKLLDIVALLDFTERDEWEEVAATYGWERSFGLKLDTADIVYQQYEIEEELRPLMKQHRRMALAQGPLRKRIEVLRQIAQKDSACTSWSEDLKQFEKARLKELLDIGQAANAQSDMTTLDAIVREWQHTPWTTQTPRSLSNKLDGLYVALAEQQLLPQLTRGILEARAASDINGLVGFKSQWDEITNRIRAAGSNWEPSKDTATRIDQTWKWLQSRLKEAATEHGFRQAVEALEAAIDEVADIEEIRSLEQAVRAYKSRQLPFATAERLRKYRSDRLVHTITEVVMLVLAVVGGGGLLLFLLVSYLKSS